VVAVLVYLLIAAAIYLGILYAPMGWRYYQIREAVGHAANFALHERDEAWVRQKCAEFIKKTADVTVRPNECVIQRDRTGLKVSVSYTYTETVNFVPSDHKEYYNFTIKVDSDNR
jgi:Flp pilus assembly protein TadB